MGLDCSHDAFHGAYSAFNRFRSAVCACYGGSYPPHKPGARAYRLGMDDTGEGLDPNCWYVPDHITRDSNPGLYLFLEHSDCDGELSPDECTLVADALQHILDGLKWWDVFNPPGGHLERLGGCHGAAARFIAGCRAAAAANEHLLFG